MHKRKPRTLIKCACGCGQDLISVDNKGRDRKYISGHSARGRHWVWNDKSREQSSKARRGTTKREENPHWKGGRYIDSWGYA